MARGAVYDGHGLNHLQAVENMKRYAQKHGFTKKNGEIHAGKLGEFLDTNYRTITKFLSGTGTFQGGIFSVWAQRTGTHEQFWRGFALEEDGSDFEDLKKAQYLNDEAWAIEAVKARRLERLFSFLGYRYEYQPIAGILDPDQFDPEAERTHYLACYDSPDTPITIRDEQLEDLIRELKSTLNYQLYKLQQKGND